MTTDETRDLITWLRANSSGIYRPAAEAANALVSKERENAELLRKCEYWRDKCKETIKERDALAEQVKALRGALEPMAQAMHDYEMDADGESPEKHRAMMRKARTALATGGK